MLLCAEIVKGGLRHGLLIITGNGLPVVDEWVTFVSLICLLRQVHVASGNARAASPHHALHANRYWLHVVVQNIDCIVRGRPSNTETVPGHVVLDRVYDRDLSYDFSRNVYVCAN